MIDCNKSRPPSGLKSDMLKHCLLYGDPLLTHHGKPPTQVIHDKGSNSEIVDQNTYSSDTQGELDADINVAS